MACEGPSLALAWAAPVSDRAHTQRMTEFEEDKLTRVMIEKELKTRKDGSDSEMNKTQVGCMGRVPLAVVGGPVMADQYCVLWGRRRAR